MHVAEQREREAVLFAEAVWTNGLSPLMASNAAPHSRTAAAA